MGINNFIDESYIQPILQNQGYNIVNTFTYGLIFILAIWALYEYYFKKEKINKEFLLALGGWILFGSSLRVLQDIGIYNSYLFVTPLIYIVVFGLAFPALLISKYLERYNIRYHIIWGLVGYSMGLYSLIRIPLSNFYALFWVIGLSFLWVILLLISRKVFPKFMSWWNLAVIEAHMFDASATFTALYFFRGFFEEHVVGGFLTQNYGAWTMFPMKLAVVPVVLYFIDKHSDNSEKNYIKMIILLLGAATGFRDLLVLLAS